MDTIEEYIKMSKKAAKHLMGYWRGNTGDVFFCEHLNQVIIVEDSCRGEFGMPEELYWNRGRDYVYLVDIIPLFRQDQLQEMIPAQNNYIRLEMFIKFYQSFCDTEQRCWLSSMEQFWLAYVMEEKYSKKWNGEDWVKE